ncbi:PDZ domain-containing protein GIPC1-like [Limulus polyphemus]|uniref:PDZ domain-containing protein GIPC1-like n=1 Tax=Limulus polyphemus TaxID=6850 RepID=A0ABM1BW52_LIMPO|nr:PDZ domain-containing protein GIPC1-like [Limulus polyphemus]
MNQLLGGQIGLDDFIFVHRKGQTKEVEINKTDDALGLTITDNGAGYAFIKRIKEGSLIDRLSNFIQVGDHVEKINGQNMVGCRHFEVARALKNIPKGSIFTLRLVEPLRAGFSHIGPRAGPGGSGKKSYGSGKETLRLRSKGPATVEEAPDDVVNTAVEKINSLLETYMGINDSELATRIWEQGHKINNPADFAIAVEESDLEAFGFSEDFIFDLWGAIKDAKDGRLKKDDEDTLF